MKEIIQTKEIIITSLKLIADFIIWNTIAFAAPILSLEYIPSLSIFFSLCLLSVVFLFWSFYRLYLSLVKPWENYVYSEICYNVFLSIISSSLYAAGFKIVIVCSNAFLKFFKYKTLKYANDNFIWFGIIFFIMILSWKLLVIFSDKYKNINESPFIKCLKPIFLFIFSNSIIWGGSLVMLEGAPGGAGFLLFGIILIIWFFSSIFLIASSLKLNNTLNKVLKDFQITRSIISSIIESFIYTIILRIVIFISPSSFQNKLDLIKYLIDNLFLIGLVIFIFILIKKMRKENDKKNSRKFRQRT